MLNQTGHRFFILLSVESAMQKEVENNKNSMQGPTGSTHRTRRHKTMRPILAIPSIFERGVYRREALHSYNLDLSSPWLSLNEILV